MPDSLALCQESDSEQILEILNEAIVNTTAIYDYKPRTMESMGPWFAAKQAGRFPVVGFFDDHGKLLGFGTYGTFRNWPAYKYSVEHSVYVRPGAQGKGIGKKLLTDLIRRAEEQGFHTLIAGIDSNNQVSIRLHERLGFSHSGTIKQAGFKFGSWLDLIFMQRILATPLHPSEN